MEGHSLLYHNTLILAQALSPREPVKRKSIRLIIKGTLGILLKGCLLQSSAITSFYSSTREFGRVDTRRLDADEHGGSEYSSAGTVHSFFTASSISK